MGYGEQYLATRVSDWLEQGWLRRGDRLIEFGSQEFYGEPAAIKAAVRDFLVRQGKSAEECEDVVGGEGPILVSAIYRTLGIDYTAIDVDSMYGSAYFDLNTFSAPHDWIGYFDFVNNEGTIEHLVNPINGFHVAHDMLKVGGIARHHGPMTGMREHGFVYPTAKFYAHLVGDNSYQVLKAAVRPKGQPVPFNDPLFRIAPDDLALVDLEFELIVRKTRAQPFVFPADHLFHGDAALLRRKLDRNMHAYARRRLTGDA